MRPSRFGGLLLGIGAAVGVAAVIGLTTGFEPSRLPPALVDLAVYKLTFAAAAGLLAAGAIVRRYARRDETARSLGAARASGTLDPVLPAPPAEAEFSKREDARSKVEIPKGQ